MFSFSGNAHLVYAIIRKRNVFHQLANLPTDPTGIKKPGKQGERRNSDSSVDDGGFVVSQRLATFIQLARVECTST